MDTPVSCPVCTLYLREGVSLQNHLNTHPKDQVIEALLKYCGSVRDVSASGDIESAVDAHFENEQNDQTVVEGSVPTITSQQQYPCSSSHFTAAVTYQQFMSSNASVGGSVLPQCFSVPAIITTPAGEPGQATLMPLLYNPYVIQQQQQQLQFYNAFRSIPQQPLSRQIVSPPLFPISPQFSMATTGNPIYQTSLSSSSTLQNGENIEPDPTIFVPSVTVEEGTDLKSSDDREEASSENPKFKENDNSKECDVQSIGDNEQGVKFVETESKNDICNSPEISIVVEDDLNDMDHVDCAKDISSTGNIYEDVDNEGNIDLCNKPVEDDENCSIENDGDSNVEDPPSSRVSPCLRVRSDLNRINQNSNDCFLVDDRNNNSPELCTDDNARDENEDPSVSGHKTVSDNGWGFHPPREKITSDVIFIGSREKDGSEYITSDVYPTVLESKNSEEPMTVAAREQESNTSPRHFKVVDIEGMQVLVASHIPTENEHQNASRDNEHPVRTPSQHSSCESMPHDNEDVNATTNPDIQTDEVMPAMGELSGQESIGENDTNSWSQEKDDIATSYDLLAREKWEVSDGSDEENEDVDVVGVATESMVCEEQPLSTDQLSPLPESERSPSEQMTSSSTCVVPSSERLVLIHSQSLSPPLPPPFQPPNQVVPLPTGSSVREEGREEKCKKKEKPRCFYKCWTCNQVFTCPKERRVHQSEKHGVARLDPKLGSLKSSSWPLVKSEDNLQVDGALKQEGEKISVKTESDLLPSIPEELNGSKSDPDPKPKSFREDCVNDIKNIEDASKSPEDAFKFICSRCEGVFASAKSLHCHVRTVHGQSQFTCRTCGEKFPSEVTYLAHLKIHPLECSRCGKYFYRHQNLNLHIRRHLGIKPFKCTICDKAFVTKQKLAEHTNTHTGDTPIKCNLCTETFRRYSNLIQHKNRHHLKIKKKVKDFICHCGEVFHSQKKLLWHKEIHDEKPKTCNFCSERFVHASSLTRHIRKAHDQRYFPCQGRESENVECPICGCIFLKSSLPVHMRLHSGERPYNCHICGKNFSTKWNLQLHRWTHASRSLKPFKCSLCKSAFIRHSEYTSHMHSHRNVRPYTCNYCGSQFIRKYNCIRHAREHESEKPFTCNICQKSFHRRYYLKEHMRIHSGLRPFTCHICGKTSSTKSNHNKHVKIHHAREAVNTEG